MSRVRAWAAVGRLVASGGTLDSPGPFHATTHNTTRKPPNGGSVAVASGARFGQTVPHAADQRGITGTPLPMHLGRAQRMGIALHEGEGHHGRRGRAQAAHERDRKQGCREGRGGRGLGAGLLVCGGGGAWVWGWQESSPVAHYASATIVVAVPSHIGVRIVCGVCECVRVRVCVCASVCVSRVPLGRWLYML